jgi:hypothetical protein
MIDESKTMPPERYEKGRESFGRKKLKGLKLERRVVSLAGLPDGLFSNQKIQIWVNFGGSCIGRWRYILGTLGPFYALLLYFMDIRYS